MSPLRCLALLFLGLALGACSTTPDFEVKVVDGDSGAPLAGVKINDRTAHYTGVKTMERHYADIGETDTDGAFTVKGLKMYSRDHALSFKKPGYEKMHFYAWPFEGRYPAKVANSRSEDVGDILWLTESPVVVNPMRRKEQA